MIVPMVIFLIFAIVFAFHFDIANERIFTKMKTPDLSAWLVHLAWSYLNPFRAGNVDGLSLEGAFNCSVACSHRKYSGGICGIAHWREHRGYFKFRTKERKTPISPGEIAN